MKTEIEKPTAKPTVSESTVRRMARSRGYELRKSHRRDPNAGDYGLWNVFDPQMGGYALGHHPSGTTPYAWTLEEVAAWLRDGQNGE